MANRLFHSVKSEPLVDTNEYAHQSFKVCPSILTLCFRRAGHIPVEDVVSETISPL